MVKGVCWLDDVAEGRLGFACNSLSAISDRWRRRPQYRNNAHIAMRDGGTARITPMMVRTSPREMGIVPQDRIMECSQKSGA